jgi:hypothetical protein
MSALRTSALPTSAELTGCFNSSAADVRSAERMLRETLPRRATTSATANRLARPSCRRLAAGPECHR